MHLLLLFIAGFQGDQYEWHTEGTGTDSMFSRYLRPPTMGGFEILHKSLRVMDWTKENLYYCNRAKGN